jgi:acetyl-CoA synthetase
MAEYEHENVAARPVASRMKGTDGRPKPHLGPGLEDYEKLHGKTVGQDSDEYWRQVSDCHSQTEVETLD